MPRRVGLVLILCALIVTLQAQHVHELLSRGGPLLFPHRVEHGRLVVGRLEQGPAPPFAAAGLREGDVVEAAFDAAGAGGPVDGLERLLDVGRRASEDAPMRLVVRRPAAGDARLYVDVPLPAASGGGILAVRLAWTILLPAASLLAALLLGLMKAEDDRAFIGSLLFLALAGTFGVNPFALPPVTRSLAVVTRLLCTFGTAVLFLSFFLIFPTPSLIERRMRWLKHAALAVMAAGALAMIARSLAELRSLATVTVLDAWLPEQAIGRVSLLAGAAFMGIGLLSLTLNTLRPQSRDDRRRMVIILGGTLVSPLTGAGIATYFTVADRPPGLSVAVLLGLVIAIFPLSVVYAVVRHRVLGIRLMVRRGVQHAVVSAGFRVLLTLLVFALFWFFIGPLFAPVGEAPFANAVIAGVAALLAARLLRTVRSQVMPAIDRRYFRDAYDAKRVLTELSHSARELALEPDRLLSHVVHTVSQALHPRTAAVMTRAVDPATGRPSGPFRCVAFQQNEGAPAAVEGLSIPESGIVARRVGAGPGDRGRLPEDVFLDEPRSWAHVLVTDPRHAGERASLEALGVQLVAPLVAGPRLIGLLLLGEKRSEEPYSRDDKELLATVAEQTALALDYGQLARRSAREEALRKELDIARNVQTRLFPQFLPRIPGLDYAGACRPAREIGGDCYDFIALGDTRLGLALGDISGKGVAAALLMANLQALLRSHAPLPDRALKDLVGDINRLLAASIPDNRFATFFYGVFDSACRSFTYVNAGHNPPMLLRAGAARPERLLPTGVMLGVFEGATFEQATVELGSGDLLVVYSDGVSDALNSAGEDYSDERLERVVKANAALSAEELIGRILDDVGRFGEQVAAFDDMTLVVAKVQ